MKKYLSMFLMVLLTFTIPQISYSADYTIDEKGIILEAENCSLRDTYAVFNATDAVGGKYVTNKAGSQYTGEVANGTQGELEFSLDSGKVKKYALWIRCIASTASSDSIFYTLNNKSYLSAAFRTGNSWEWKKLGILTLSEGENIIRLHRREIGVKLDRIMLCELRYIPEKEGKLPSLSEDYYVENPYKNPVILPPENVHPRLFVNSNILGEIGKKTEVLSSILPLDTEIYEAEYHNFSGIYKKYKNENAGNGYYLNPNSNALQTSDVSDAEVTVLYNAKKSGKHAIWIRCIATSGGSDSIWMKYNKSDWKIYGIPISQGFKWVKIGDVDFTAGENSVYFHHREAYMGLDRILITSDIYAETITEKISSNSHIYDAYIQLLAYKNAECSRIYTLPENWDNKNYEINDLSVIQAKAYDYLVNRNIKSAKSAKEILLNFARTANFPSGNIDAVRNLGETVFSGALVYDWCYDAFGESEKEELRSILLDLQSTMETGYPPNTYACVSGHMGEYEVLRDTMSLAVAIYDEDKSLYNMAAGGFFENMLEWYNYMYEGGYHSQGDSYGPYRYSAELAANYLFSAMGYDNLFSKKQKDIAYGYIYSVRGDGQRFRDGDSSYSRTTETTAFMRGEPMFLAANYYKDEYINQRFSDIYEKCGNQDIPHIYYMLFGDLSLGKKDISELPQTRFFNEPAGVMMARTSWESGKNSDSVSAFFKIGTRYFGGHHHIDSGQFQLYYKGGLAVDSGIYNVYGDTHDVNYNKRTIAHNTMLVYNPHEKMTYAEANDGGQRSLEMQVPKTLSENLSDEYKLGEVKAYGFGPDLNKPYYSYLKGNITDAYSDKVEDFERSFVFLNFEDDTYPAAVIVFDKVTASDAAFKKTWLLHSVEEPLVSGNRTTIKRTEYDYNGKLINTALLPTQAEIKISGGKGSEFMIGDKNYSASYTITEFQEGAGYRVEISPQNPSETDYFLNVMQVMDNDNGLNGQSVEKFENNLFAGAYIGKSLTMFSKNEDVDHTFEINVPENTRTVIFGLKSGMWQIKDNSGNTYYRLAKDNDKAVSFETEKEGNYIFTPLESSVETEVLFVGEDNILKENITADTKLAKVNIKTDAPVDVFGVVKDENGVLTNIEKKEFKENSPYSFKINVPENGSFELYVWKNSAPVFFKQVFAR